MPEKPPRRDDDIPDDLDNLMILSPEQYEVLLTAREEQQEDLSRDQAETLLRGSQWDDARADDDRSRRL
ncbi:hypothetical protein QLQ12_02585 [Actinoplanes sp. NEAU-A12]|uniref:Uncharacterized protein n=1 Tax=Actinoplanes sandaracinus TaxID=3045177 RepID=A0ABT6WCP8_9ACTN|nr:hypothetical protein [Actinoplanes sandaracinus]MDI6097485.1 hypothetical protein [Actinoplanes sandaracinus]